MTYFLYFILGSSLGSFIGLVCDRFPEQSIILPRSHCSACQKTLKIGDLIPIFSQVHSGSRCRYCCAAIPKRYLFIEFSSGLTVLAFSLGIVSLTELLLLLLSLCLSIYDWESKSFPLAVWIIGSIPFIMLEGINFLQILFCAMALIAYHHDIKIGEGDFLYMATLSFCFRGQELLYIIETACLLGILFALRFKEKRLPFIPFLAVAMLLVLVLKKLMIF